MYLERSDDQQAMAAACRKLLADTWPTADISGALSIDSVPDGAWVAATEMGWMHVLRREKVGGLGLTAVEAGVVAEESGRALFAGPILEGMVAGQLTEVDPTNVTMAGVDAIDIELDGDRATGVASIVPYADRCAALVLPMADAAIVVDLRSSGVVIERLKTADLVSRPCRVSLDRAQFEIARDGDSARWLEVTARCLFAARLLGVLESALDRASSYAMEREQFGRPIGSFQAVQQLLADMKKLAVASRSICYASQAAVAEGRDDAARLTRAAKAYVGLAARNVVEQSIQVHGGIGFTTEVPLHLYLKHALTLVDAWGAAHEQHLVLGKLALDKYQDNDSAS